MGRGRPRNTEANFWSKVRRGSNDECWPWSRGTRNGYGHHCVNRQTVYAHRYAYEIACGPIPEGAAVMHKCNNKHCCNPSHLEVGDARANTIAAYRDGLAKAGMRHHKTKLPTHAVAEIRASDLPQTRLAAIYGVSQSHISRIKLGQSRAHEEING